jgi:multidrug efflux pump subunit AcrA (membrane-fusion protein)
MNRKEKMMKNKNQPRFLGLILAAGLLLSACGGVTATAQSAATLAPVTTAGGSVTAEGHLVPVSHTDLYFQGAGRVSEVRVKEGDLVKKGDVLVSLGDREAAQAAISAAQLAQAAAQRQMDDLQKNAALAKAQAQADLTAAQKTLIQAQQALTDLDTSDYTTLLDATRTDVSKANDDLIAAQDAFNKVSDLAVDNLTRKTAETKLKDMQKAYDTAVHKRDLLINQMDDARAQVDLTKARVDDAQAVVNARQNGPDPADLTPAQAGLKNAQDQLAAAQAALARMDLIAPYDGTVVQINVELNDQASPAQPAAVIADLSKWVVETSDLTEKQVVSVALGQKVTLALDALPDLKLNGTVAAIGQTFVEKSGDIDYVVRIPVDSGDTRLRWGMTVTVTIQGN